MVAVPGGKYILASDVVGVDAEREIAAANQRAERAERYVAGEDLRSDFRTAAEMRAALDEQAEAVRVLAGEISEWRLAHVCSPVSLIDAPIIRARKRTANNHIAAAAVKEAGGEPQRNDRPGGGGMVCGTGRVEL
jgi:hypothetical protein